MSNHTGFRKTQALVGLIGVGIIVLLGAIYELLKYLNVLPQ